MKLDDVISEDPIMVRDHQGRNTGVVVRQALTSAIMVLATYVLNFTVGVIALSWIGV